MHEKYTAQPEAIDWASYKAFFDDHPEIAKLQSKYESAKAVEMPTHQVIFVLFIFPFGVVRRHLI